MRRSLFAVLAPAVAAAAVLASSAEARAGMFIGADLDLGSPFDSTASFGVGFAGRLGYRIGLGPVWLQPEGSGNYTNFGSDFPGVRGAATRVMGGARFGLGGIFQPSLFGHAGFGWVASSLPTVHGPAFDVGLALDLKLIPYLTFGAHVGYNVVTISTDLGSTGFKWINYGPHVGLVF